MSASNFIIYKYIFINDFNFQDLYIIKGFIVMEVRG